MPDIPKTVSYVKLVMGYYSSEPGYLDDSWKLKIRKGVVSDEEVLSTNNLLSRITDMAR